MNRINDYVLCEKRGHPGSISYTLLGTRESLDKLASEIREKCLAGKIAAVGISTGDGETDRVSLEIKLVSNEELIKMQQKMPLEWSVGVVARLIVVAFAIYGLAALLLKLL